MKYSTLPHDIYTRIRNWIQALYRRFRDWSQVTWQRLSEQMVMHYGPDILYWRSDIEAIVATELNNAIEIDTARRNPDQPIDTTKVKRHKGDPRTPDDLEATVVVEIKNPATNEIERVVVTIKIGGPSSILDISRIAEMAAIGMVEAVKVSPEGGVGDNWDVVKSDVIYIR